MKIDVSIIYVNYKTASLVLDSIHSVKEKTQGVSYEVIVVDNASEDGSEVLVTTQYPEVRYVQAGANLGFGRANNLGVAEAKGEYILFLNPDTLLENDAVSILYDFLREHQEVGACGGNLVDGECRPTFSLNRVDFTLIQEFLSIFYLRPFLWKERKSFFYNFSDKPLEVRSIIGADLMVRRSLIDRIGAFDPDFFMNGEDIELCYRIIRSGHKVYSVPDARIVHLEGKSSYIKVSRLQLLYEGNYRLFSKIYSFAHARKLFHIIQWKCRLRYLLFKCLGNKEKQTYWKTKREVNEMAWSNFIKGRNGV
ncbi:glycosyltransferase family 2 protein [Parabacteroides sp.]